MHRKRYQIFDKHITLDTLEQVTDANRDGYWSERELGDALDFIHKNHDAMIGPAAEDPAQPIGKGELEARSLQTDLKFLSHAKVLGTRVHSYTTHSPSAPAVPAVQLYTAPHGYIKS